MATHALSPSFVGPDPLPPGPGARSLLGALRPLAADPLTFFEDNRRRFGDVAHFRIGLAHAIQLGDPALIQAVLVGRQHHFVKDAVTRGLSTVMGAGLVTSEGELWRHQRKLIAPSFQPRHLARYADTMVEQAERAAQALVAAGRADLHQAMMRLTLAIVVSTLFDEEPTDELQKVSQIVSRLMKAFERNTFGWRRLLPARIRSHPHAAIPRLAAELDEVLYPILRRRRERPLGEDLLSRLLAARDEAGDGMSERQLRDEAITIFLAGHETTAVALTFALHQLASHPEVAARLRAEVDEVLGGRPARASDVPQLRLTDAVLRETLRLYPPVWAIGREVVAECEIGGYRLRPGTQVLMPAWVVQHDERWFDHPLAFRPERWQEGLAERLPPMAYFPFGGGPRICVGNHFALLEATLVLATLVARCELALVRPGRLALEPAVTLRPRGGLPMTIRARPSLSP